MANDFWAAQRAADSTRAWDAVGEAVAGNFARRDQRRAAADGERLSLDLDRAYRAAVAAAAESGEIMPTELVAPTVMVDDLVRQTAVKSAAIRELKRLDPNHPLTRPAVREEVAREALRNFNRQGRPTLTAQRHAESMAPSDDAIAQIFSQRL